jgi:enoyl-CoA hydratase
MTNNFLLFKEIPGTNGNIGQITLNRPQVLNALRHDMIQALHAQLQQWENADHIKAVIIQSNHPRVFCAGGDIREIYNRGRVNPREACLFLQDEYRLNQYIHDYPKPYIALLDGLTMGGGAGISVHGSYRIATENFVFSMPETGIGFFPDIGSSYFLPRCPGYTGYYLGLTGVEINTADAIALGIATHHLPKNQLDKLVEAIAETDNIKNAIQQWNMPAGEPPINQYREEIERCFSASTIENIIARLHEKNTAWHQEIIHTLLQKSPISLKITLQQLQRGSQLDIAACFQMEANLAAYFLETHDFYEGVRAMIIDKDRTPHWQPNALEYVHDKNFPTTDI